MKDPSIEEMVIRLKEVRRLCPGMGLLLGKQLLIKNNWSIQDAVREARTTWPDEMWPAAIRLAVF